MWDSKDGFPFDFLLEEQTDNSSVAPVDHYAYINHFGYSSSQALAELHLNQDAVDPHNFSTEQPPIPIDQPDALFTDLLSGFNESSNHSNDEYPTAPELDLSSTPPSAAHSQILPEPPASSSSSLVDEEFSSSDDDSQDEEWLFSANEDEDENWLPSAQPHHSPPQKKRRIHPNPPVIQDSVLPTATVVAINQDQLAIVNDITNNWLQQISYRIQKTCPQCSKIIKNERGNWFIHLFRHVSNDYKIQFYKCSRCGKGSTEAYEVRRHINKIGCFKRPGRPRKNR